MHRGFRLRSWLSDLALLAPGRFEADVDDQEDTDIESEGHLTGEIDARTAADRLLRDCAPRFDPDRDRNQSAENLRMPLEEHECRDFDDPARGEYLYTDDEQDADIPGDRQANDDLRPEAELHAQRGTELGVGPDIKIHLTDGIDSRC